MLIKLTYVGPIQGDPGKTYREIGAEEFNGEKKRAYKSAPSFDGCKAGDQMDVMLSDNQKYINAAKKPGNPTPASGGKGYSKGTYGAASDPEKNVSVYTSYVLEYLIAPHQKTPLSIAEAVKMVFDIRAAVAAAFAGKPAPSAAQATTSAEEAIKIDAAIAMVKAVDEGADAKVWAPYIANALKRKGGYDLLMKNLNACLTGEKILDYTPDGTPAFNTPGE